MKRIIKSFDGTEKIYSDFERPERYNALFDILKKSSPLIARGAGLSYCLASAGEGASSISSRLFNRVLDFDEERGEILVEPGMTIGELFDLVVKHGWFFPVIPGHTSITIGGCAAFNVHGKTQYDLGNFIEFVQEFKLFHPDHGEITCSRLQNSEIFFLTLGGFGLTGYITEIKLRLHKLDSEFVILKRTAVENLCQAAALMEDTSKNEGKLYSWNDLNQKGRKFGRGIVYESIKSQNKFEVARKIDQCLAAETRSGILPPLFHNKFATTLFCEAFYRKERLLPEETLCGLKESCFPINGKEIYYHLFGKNGFREYQMIIPFVHWDEAIARIQELIAGMQIPIALGSLKLFHAFSGQQYLNFCQEGVCLSLDVPSRAPVLDFFNRLDEIVIKFNGISNLSKDSRISAGTVEKMFPEYHRFKSKLREFDPKKRFVSALRRRIDV